MSRKPRLSAVVLCALAASVVPSTAAQQGLDAPGRSRGLAASRPLDLRLMLRDPEGLMGPAASRMQHEVTLILDAAGVGVAWSDADCEGSSGNQTEGARELAVIVLAEGRRSERGTRIMGSVPVMPARHAVWVYVRPIWRALELPPDRRSASEAETKAFAIATGRVAVHEIVHALLPDAPHTPGGLMRAALDRCDLAQGRVALPAAYASALRRMLGTQGGPPWVAHASLARDPR